MSTIWKIVFGIIVLLVLGLTFLETTEPEPINLNPSYSGADKIPLGSYALFESWKNQREITEINIPPFEVLSKDSILEGTYFFLNDYVVFDNNELEKVLNWVGQGNSLFISAGYISKNLLDTLKLQTQTHTENLDFKSRPELKIDEESYNVNFDIETRYFSKIDSAATQVLGEAISGDQAKKQSNFIKTSFQNGKIYLHTTPEAFSNYFMLQKENFRYVEKVLGNLDGNKNLYWDTYYKSGKTIYTSPLYYLLSNKNLKWAYYFVLIAAVIFIIFEGKRKQRPIPVVPPLKNQTYQYAETIGGLYLEQNRYREMAGKKIALFFEYIRTYFRIMTHEVSEDFIQKLAEKSNHNPERIRTLIKKIRAIEEKQHISKEEFLSLSQDIQQIKNKTNGRFSE